MGGDDHGWCDFVDIGRTHTHCALALDAKAATAFPARRDCGTGDPIRHVAPTLTEVLRLYVEASTAWKRLNITIETERLVAAVQSHRAASARGLTDYRWARNRTRTVAGDTDCCGRSGKYSRLAVPARQCRYGLQHRDGPLHEQRRFGTGNAQRAKCVGERQFIGHPGGNHGAGSTHPFESGVRSHATGEVSTRCQHQKNGLLQRSPSTCHDACRVTTRPGW